MMAQLKSLVTGGAGFIGSHVARRLLILGHEVIVLDDLSGGFTDNLPEGVSFCKGSITDSELVDRLFREYRFDYVYHLAAYAAEGLSPFIRRFNYSNNLIGSINLINASIEHKIKCFVFTSSIAVYGDLPLPYSERQIPQPTDPYGIAKYAVELDLKNALEQFGLNSIIFRPHNVYGIGQNIGDKYRNVVGIFMNQLLKGNPLTIFGDGEQTRAFTHVNDVAEYIAHSINHRKAYNQTFNIGSDKHISINVLAESIAKAMGKTIQCEYQEQRHEMIHAYADHHLFNQVFKPENETPLNMGLIEMADWVQKVGARETVKFEEIEIEKGLPPAWH